MVNAMIVYGYVMSKWKKMEMGHIFKHFWVLGHQAIWINFFKKFILDKKESLDPKMTDFEWFGEVFNFSMFNMLELDLSLFAYFWS